VILNISFRMRLVRGRHGWRAFAASPYFRSDGLMHAGAGVVHSRVGLAY
jgi:hypothetical protein